MKETTKVVEIPADDSMAALYQLGVKDQADEREKFEVVLGWAMLGQFDEAQAYFLAVPPSNRLRHVAAQCALFDIYEMQFRNEDIVQIGQALIATNEQTIRIVVGTAIALTFLGRHREARETLALVEGLGRPLAHHAYQMACLASLENDFPDALRWLEIEARNPRYLDARSIGDSDLFALWQWLPRGKMRLEDGHRLLALPLRSLCAEALDPGHEIQVDQNDLKRQPAKFRQLFKYSRSAGMCVLDPMAVARKPEVAAAFRKARRAHVAGIVAMIEEGYRRALNVVLAAQPRYAAEQAAQGNPLGVRYHLTFALARRPEMLEDFRREPGLAKMQPLIEGFAAVQGVDPGFCRRMELIWALLASDADAAWTTLEETPAAARCHPLYLLRRANVLGADRDYLRALPISLQVIAAWPEDAAGFDTAIHVLMQLGRWEDAATVLGRAPECYRRFGLYRRQRQQIAERNAVGSGRAEPFRGQPNLGGILCEGEPTEVTTTTEAAHE